MPQALLMPAMNATIWSHKMFTGLVADIGKIAARRSTGKGVTITLETSFETSDIELGESIAIDGACLTVTAIGDATFDVDASPETLARTTLGDRQRGDGVHLERALRLGDRLGGHLVQGHVDGVGTVQRRHRDGNAWIFSIEAPPSVSPYLIEKGSITVDGVSLTVNRSEGDHFDIAIIPHTAEKTLVADYRPGRRVNLEADMLGKYIRKFVDARGQGLKLDDLIDAGFQ